MADSPEHCDVAIRGCQTVAFLARAATPPLGHRSAGARDRTSSAASGALGRIAGARRRGVRRITIEGDTRAAAEMAARARRFRRVAGRAGDVSNAQRRRSRHCAAGGHGGHEAARDAHRARSHRGRLSLYFALFAAFLYNQDLLRLPYMLITAWLLTVTLMRIHQTTSKMTVREAAGLTGKMFARRCRSRFCCSCSSRDCLATSGRCRRAVRRRRDSAMK